MSFVPTCRTIAGVFAALVCSTGVSAQDAVFVVQQSQRRVGHRP